YAMKLRTLKRGKMKRQSPVVAITLAVMCATNCGQKSTRSNVESVTILAIKDDQARWLKDFKSNDLDRIVSHLAADAIVIEEGVPVAHGPEQARSLYRQMLADPARSLEFAPWRVEIDRSGEMGYAIGSYTAGFSDPITKKPKLERGNYISIYKKDKDGFWKV